jgi:hypothetical protein
MSSAVNRHPSILIGGDLIKSSEMETELIPMADGTFKMGESKLTIIIEAPDSSIPKSDRTSIRSLY